MCGGETDELQEMYVVDGTATTAIEAVEHLQHSHTYIHTYLTCMHACINTYIHVLKIF